MPAINDRCGNDQLDFSFNRQLFDERLSYRSFRGLSIRPLYLGIENCRRMGGSYGSEPERRCDWTIHRLTLEPWWQVIPTSDSAEVGSEPV